MEQNCELCIYKEFYKKVKDIDKTNDDFVNFGIKTVRELSDTEKKIHLEGLAYKTSKPLMEGK